MKRHKPYSGVLKKPIRLGPTTKSGTILSKREADVESINRQTKLRLKALFDHYDIPQDDSKISWEELALRLADRHVSGFKVSEAPHGRPKGRPQGSRVDPLTLYHLVNRHRAEKAELTGRRPSVAEALGHFPNRYPEYGALKLGTLENLHIKGRKARLSELKRIDHGASWRSRGRLARRRYLFALGPALGRRDGLPNREQTLRGTVLQNDREAGPEKPSR